MHTSNFRLTGNRLIPWQVKFIGISGFVIPTEENFASVWIRHTVKIGIFPVKLEKHEM
jgi:hypothetical protein